MAELNPAGGNAVAATEEPIRDYVVQSSQPEVKADTSTDEKPKDVEPKKKDDAEDSAADTDNDPDAGEGKKKRGGWQRKIDRLNAELAAEKAKNAGVKPVEDPAKPKAAAETIEGLRPKPDPNDPKYKDKTWAEYNEDLIDWKDEKRQLERTAESKKVEAKKDLETKVSFYKEKASEAKKIHDDFDEVLQDYEGPQSPELHRALIESDNGAEVAYYLASNPEEAEKMRGMNKDQLNRFIGRVEAKLETGIVKETPAVKTSKAPPPIKPVGKGSASEPVIDFPENGTYEEKKAWEKRQKK